MIRRIVVVQTYASMETKYGRNGPNDQGNDEWNRLCVQAGCAQFGTTVLGGMRLDYG